MLTYKIFIEEKNKYIKWLMIYLIDAGFLLMTIYFLSKWGV